MKAKQNLLCYNYILLMLCILKMSLEYKPLRFPKICNFKLYFT